MKNLFTVTRGVIVFFVLLTLLATNLIAFAQTNVVINGDFEDTFPAVPWESDFGIISPNTSNPHTGSASAQMVTEDPVGARLYQCVPWPGGTDTYVSIRSWLYLEPANLATVNVGVYPYSNADCTASNNDGANLMSFQPDADTTGAWQEIWTGPAQVGQPLEVPNDTLSLLIVFDALDNGSGPATIYVDDVMVYQSTPTVVGLTSLDAQPAIEPPSLWLVLLALPLGLGASALILRRRRA